MVWLVSIINSPLGWMVGIDRRNINIPLRWLAQSDEPTQLVSVCQTSVDILLLVVRSLRRLRRC